MAEPGGDGIDFDLDPTLDFMRLLWSIEHRLQRVSKKMEGELGITGPQRLVLRVVGQFPDISAGDLARVLQLHPSTITGILQRLGRRGLIERKRDPADSRRARLRIKPAALAFTRLSPATIEKAVALALEDGGAANVRAARKVLTAVAARLSEM